MFTINAILKEINELPPEQLDEVYEFVHSIRNSKKQKESTRKKILSFSGAFKDMPQKDYAEFKQHVTGMRVTAFNRQ